MSTFYILQINVKDADKLQEYIDAAPATVLSCGGELVFRGNISDVVSGVPEHTFAAVLKFPDIAMAKAWYESNDYQALVKNRDAAADVIVTRYEETDFF